MHSFHVAPDWNNGTPSTPWELKTYRTTMEEKFDPTLDGDEKAETAKVKMEENGDVDNEPQNNFTRESLFNINPTFSSDSSIGLDSPMNVRIAGTERPETPLKVAYPTPDRTKARSSTVGDLENIAVGLSSVLFTPEVSPTRISRLY